MWASPNVSAYLHVDSTDYIVQYMLHGLDTNRFLELLIGRALPKGCTNTRSLSIGTGGSNSAMILILWYYCAPTCVHRHAVRITVSPKNRNRNGRLGRGAAWSFTLRSEMAEKKNMLQF